MSEPQLTRIVAGCVLERDGKYLLVQEKKESAYGMWNLPAGRVDVGETFEDAAVREVFEETGFKVKLIHKLPVEHEEVTRPVLHAFKAEIIGGELLFPKNELLDARWFTRDEVRQLESDGKMRTGWIVRSINESSGNMIS